MNPIEAIIIEALDLALFWRLVGRPDKALVLLEMAMELYSAHRAILKEIRHG